jgi:hypothetical protein
VNDPDGGDVWRAHFGAVVSRYLSSGGGMSPEAGAAAFSEPINRAFLHDDAWDDYLESVLWGAWGVIVSAADTPDDADRARLVSLLTAIKGQGILARADGRECTVWGLGVYVDLPVFGPEMRETWNDSPPGMSPGSWANLNAFAAQLTVGGIDFSLYGIWALRDALEADDGDVSLVLPAAVQWLRCAGPALASLALNGAISDNSAAWLGPLCVNAGLTDLGYTTRRWNFWKSRLEEIAAAGGESAGLAREGLRYLLAAGQQETS